MFQLGNGTIIASLPVTRTSFHVRTPGGRLVRLWSLNVFILGYRHFLICRRPIEYFDVPSCLWRISIWRQTLPGSICVITGLDPYVLLWTHLFLSCAVYKSSISRNICLVQPQGGNFEEVELASEDMKMSADCACHLTRASVRGTLARSCTWSRWERGKHCDQTGWNNSLIRR